MRAVVGGNGHVYLTGAAEVSGCVNRRLRPRQIEIAASVDGDGTEILPDGDRAVAARVKWGTICDRGATG